MYTEIGTRQMLIIGSDEEEQAINKMLRLRHSMWQEGVILYDPVRLLVITSMLTLLAFAASDSAGSPIIQVLVAIPAVAVFAWGASLFFRAYRHTRLYRRMMEEGRVLDFIDSSIMRPFINQILFDDDAGRGLSVVNQRRVLRVYNTLFIEDFLRTYTNRMLLRKLETLREAEAADAKAELVRRAKLILEDTERFARPLRTQEWRARLVKIDAELAQVSDRRDRLKGKLVKLAGTEARLNREQQDLERRLGTAIQEEATELSSQIKPFSSFG